MILYLERAIMKKVNFITALAAAFALALATSLSIQPVQAKSTYKIVKTVSYPAKPYHTHTTYKKAAVWNKKHTKRLNYLKNYPHTTWYALATLTMKHGSKHSIFYKVQSGNKKHSGYVWRGYLEAGNYKFKPGNQVYDPLRPNTFKETQLIDTKLNKQIADLFPGTIRDNQMQLAADMYNIKADVYNNHENATASTDILGENNFQDLITLITNQRYSGNPKGLMNFVREQLATELDKQGRTFTDFKDYKIGAYIYPKNSKKDYGKTVVYLLPKAAVLPKLPPVYYYDGTGVWSSQINEFANNQIISWFPGTKKNKQVQFSASLAYSYLDVDSYDEDLIDIFGNNSNIIKLQTFVSSEDTSSNQFIKDEKAALQKELRDYAKSTKTSKTKLTDFKGYKIGAYVVQDNFKPRIDSNYLPRPGYVTVLLVPPTVKLPKIDNYIFDMDHINLLD